MRHLITLILIASFSAPAWAEGSPWLPIPRSGSLSVSHVYQDAEKFYRGKDRRRLPFGGIEQSTTWVTLNYGLAESVALDVQGGYSEVEADNGMESDGMTDTTIGLTWRVIDEDISEAGAPSVAVRVAGIIAGDYDTGMPWSVGDGGDGFEGSLIAGKIFGNRFALSAEVGRRERNSKVPGETFLNAAAYFLASPRLSLSARYHKTMSDGDLDIGGYGFSPARFPETDEDIDRVALGGSFNLTDQISLGLNWFSILDGRNTADFDAILGTITYTFDIYNLGGQ